MGGSQSRSHPLPETPQRTEWNDYSSAGYDPRSPGCGFDRTPIVLERDNCDPRSPTAELLRSPALTATADLDTFTAVGEPLQFDMSVTDDEDGRLTLMKADATESHTNQGLEQRENRSTALEKENSTHTQTRMPNDKTHGKTLHKPPPVLRRAFGESWNSTPPPPPAKARGGSSMDVVSGTRPEHGGMESPLFRRREGNTSIVRPLLR